MTVRYLFIRICEFIAILTLYLTFGGLAYIAAFTDLVEGFAWWLAVITSAWCLIYAFICCYRFKRRLPL